MKYSDKVMVMKPMSVKQRKLLQLLFYFFGTIIVLLWLIPIFIAIFTSTKSMDEIMVSKMMWTPPHQWIFSNYAKAWKNVGIAHYVMNSFIVTIPSVIGSLLIASLSAFALAFYSFKANKPILITFIAGMLIPFQMLMIPVYRFSDATGLINTYIGIILFHIAFQLGFCTFFLRNFMKQIPFSLIEAPRIDGASDFFIYRKIVLPLSISSMAALAVLEFTWIWNDLLWSLILLQQDKLKTVTLGLANMQGEFITNYNMVAAGSIIASIPPLIVFLLFQRYFISGLTVGAEKA